jgi:tetratricopeptide (TPR) repeat protein
MKRSEEQLSSAAPAAGSSSRTQFSIIIMARVPSDIQSFQSQSNNIINCGPNADSSSQLKHYRLLISKYKAALYNDTINSTNNPDTVDCFIHLIINYAILSHQSNPSSENSLDLLHYLHAELKFIGFSLSNIATELIKLPLADRIISITALLLYNHHVREENEFIRAVYSNTMIFLENSIQTILNKSDNSDNQPHNLNNSTFQQILLYLFLRSKSAHISSTTLQKLLLYSSLIAHKSPQGLFFHCKFLFLQGNFADCAAKIIEYHSNPALISAETMVMLALAQRRLKQQKTALKNLEKALILVKNDKNDPNYEVVLTNLAELYAENRNYDKSIAICANLSPTPRVLFNLAKFSLLNGNFPSALALFHRLVPTTPPENSRIPRDSSAKRNELDNKHGGELEKGKIVREYVYLLLKTGNYSVAQKELYKIMPENHENCENWQDYYFLATIEHFTGQNNAETVENLLLRAQSALNATNHTQNSLVSALLLLNRAILAYAHGNSAKSRELLATARALCDLAHVSEVSSYLMGRISLFYALLGFSERTERAAVAISWLNYRKLANTEWGSEKYKEILKDLQGKLRRNDSDSNHPSDNANCSSSINGSSSAMNDKAELERAMAEFDLVCLKELLRLMQRPNCVAKLQTLNQLYNSNGKDSSINTISISSTIASSTMME